MKRIFKRILFVLLAVFLPLVIANESIRWIWFRNYPLKKITKRDWSLFYSLMPDFNAQISTGLNVPSVWEGKSARWQLKINSDGIRHQGEIQPVLEKGFRIICLGDSVSFGLDVDDDHTYPFQLEQILKQNASSQLNIEVINAGVPGYSSTQGLIHLTKNLLKYHPNLVILEFGLNDSQLNFGLIDRWILKRDENGKWKKIYCSPLIAPVLVLQQPMFIFLWYHIYTGILYKPDYVAFIKNVERMKKNQMSEPLDIKAEMKKYKHSRVPPADFLNNLMQFIQLSQGHKFKLLFYIPYEMPPVYKQLMVNLAKAHQIPFVDFSEKLNHYEISDLKKNPVYADLLSYYEQKLGTDFIKKNPIYAVTTDMGHPNSVGNRIIAEEIANLLLSHPDIMPVSIK